MLWCILSLNVGDKSFLEYCIDLVGDICWEGPGVSFGVTAAIASEFFFAFAIFGVKPVMFKSFVATDYDD